MPEKTKEQILADKKQKITKIVEWFDRIWSQMDPQVLKEIDALGKFAVDHLQKEKLSRQDTSDDSEAAVAEAIYDHFNEREYYKWLHSKDARENTDWFQKKVKGWFTWPKDEWDEKMNGPNKGYEKHEELVSRVAEHMTSEEQEKAFGL